MTRPLSSQEIETLEAEFASRKTDKSFLQVLLAELEHRSTPRAVVLLRRVAGELSFETGDVQTRSAAGSDVDNGQPRMTEPAMKPIITASSRSGLGHYERPARRMPPLTSTPDAVLAAWTALEVLSPQSFRREADLAGGDARAISRQYAPDIAPQQAAQPGQLRRSSDSKIRLR